MIISWTLLADLGLISSRYLKYLVPTNRVYVFLHAFLFSLVFLASSASSLLMVLSWPIQKKFLHDVNKVYYFRSHIILASLHYVLLLTQVVLGTLARYKHDSMFPPYLLLAVHRKMGILLFLLAKVIFLIGNMTNATK